MNTKLYKCIIAFVLSFMALPMMAQDFMNIYFKDGNFRKFYMKNITEIVASKVDADGVEHEDYSYQQITTIYEKYIYKLEDVDSITFTKIDEEKAEENFVSAMPEVFDAIDKCETIEDVESKIDQIKNVKGVADAWSDGHELYVSIAEDDVYSFHFDHDDNANETASRNAPAQVRKIVDKVKATYGERQKGLKIAIANQQHYDESKVWLQTKYIDPLKKALEDCGIKVDYVDKPGVDFFYDNCKNPINAEHLNIYDYDLILLVTHGSYAALKYLDVEENVLRNYGFKGHSFCTAEELGFVFSSNLTNDDVVNNYHLIRQWRDNNSKYSDATDQHIKASFCEETRNGESCFVGHPSITEYFFHDIAVGTFTNPNSVLFNTSCQSLKGDGGNPSFALAEELVNNRNLGAYVGYDDSNDKGKKAGCHIFTNMLSGMSLEKAIAELSEEERHNHGTAHGSDYNANLLVFPENKDSELWLGPLVTNKLDPESVLNDYTANNKLVLWATMTTNNPDGIEIGFMYGTQMHALSEKVKADVSMKTLNVGDGNYLYGSTITDLKKNTTYFYCAYTYDGVNYHYGDTQTFCIGTPEPLPVSEDQLVLRASEDHSAFYIVKVNSGSGKYIAESSDEEVVTVAVLDEIVRLVPMGKGYATITVTDAETGHSATISVKVNSAKETPSEPIDMGLPSGTKWAEYNVGATKPEEFGSYFTWGEVGEKAIFTTETYSYYDDSNGEYRYIGSDISGTEYDAARYNWGGDWCMPTLEQFNELIENCSPEWTKRNGVNGMSFTGLNGAHLFLPAAGYSGKYWINEVGEYWTSTLWEDYQKDAKYYTFSSTFNKTDNRFRYLGLCIRPVINKLQELVLYPTDPISIVEGGIVSVDILSGNGGYTVEIDEDGKGVVTATVDGETVKITAIGAGDATIAVRDKRGQTVTINVTVTAKEADLTLSATNLVTLKVDEGRTIVITSGSGDYSVECSRDVVAKVKLRGKYISITGVREGRATITVTDNESGQMESVKVKVKARSSSSVVSLVNNGDMEGPDVSNFIERTGTWENDFSPAEITDGVGVDGSRGIEVDATDMVSEIWDNQFWILLDQPVSDGTNYRMSFDYRADKEVSSRTEHHGEPGDYICWNSLYFYTDWNTFSKDSYVYSSESSDDKPFRSLAFTLNVYEQANNYYFDNVKFEVYLIDQCPKPTFTVAENVVSIESPFNATIYYTIDGTTPTTSSSVYSSSILLDSSKSWTIRAIAVVDGYEASPVATYYYTGSSQ